MPHCWQRPEVSQIGLHAVSPWEVVGDKTIGHVAKPALGSGELVFANATKTALWVADLGEVTKNTVPKPNTSVALRELK